MFNKFLNLLFIFIFSMGVFAQESNNKSSEQILDVTLCNLLKNPNEYKDKVVRVKATYRYGFEWSELYCSDCWEMDNRVDIDFDESYRNKTKKEIIKKLDSDNENISSGKTINVVFVGKITTGGRFGHLGAYKNRLVVESIESAEVIYKLSPVPSYLPKKVKAKTYCQTKD